MKSYYDFNYDNMYKCVKLETAIKRATKDIEKLNGDSAYITEFEINDIKNEIETTGTFNYTDIGNYVINIESYENIGWYICLKYMN